MTDATADLFLDKKFWLIPNSEDFVNKLKSTLENKGKVLIYNIDNLFYNHNPTTVNN